MKMLKKIAKYGFIATLCICLFACKSTKQVENAENPESPQTEAVEETQAEEGSEQQKQKLTKEEKKAAKAEAKAAKKQEKAQKKAEKDARAQKEEETAAVEEGADLAEPAESAGVAQVTENAAEDAAAGGEGELAAAEQIEVELAAGGQAVDDSQKTGGAINFIGWVDTGNRKLDYKNGLLRIRTNPKLGNFNISVLQPTGKYLSVLSTRDEFTNSSFYLRADKKIYKLIGNGNVKSKSRKIDSGIALYYQIEDVAEVVVSFVTLSSVESGNADMLKVTASIKNNSSKVTEYSIKSVLDTVLGESGQLHFFTSGGEAVMNEVIYRNVKDCKYVVSKNNDTAMYIFVDGKDVSPIDNLSLANFSTLNIQKWEPDMLSYRTFDTVLDYNNSAVGIEWPKVKLKEKEIQDYVFYLGFSTDMTAKPCVDYIWPNGDKDADGNIMQDATVQVIPSANNFEVLKITPESDSVISVEQIGTAEKIAPVVPKIVSNEKIDVVQLTKEQVSPEYIQNLLDRIAALEEDDASINQEELAQLNAELDAILEILKQ